MARLGFNATSLPPAYAALATTVGSAVNKIETFPAAPTLEQIIALLADAKAVFDAIQNLATSPPPTGAEAGAYAAEIGERLFELLLTDYLATEHTAAFNILAMLGVVQVESVPPTATRPSYIRTRFRWEELPKVISSPADLPARVYGWGTAEFNVTLALEHLSCLFLGLDFPVRVRRTPEPITRGYLGIPDVMLYEEPTAVEVPFFYGHSAGQDLEAAFAFRELPAQGEALPGIVLEPRIPAEMPLEIDLHPKVKMRLRAGTNAGALFGLAIRPNDIALRYPLAPGTPPPAAGVGIGFDFTPAAPVLLLGDPNASRIDFAAASVDLGGEFATAHGRSLLGSELKGLQVVLDAGEGDSFIKNIIGAGKTTVGIPLGVEWSQNNGIRFKGSAAFEVALYPHFPLGPVKVDEITVKIARADRRAEAADRLGAWRRHFRRSHAAEILRARDRYPGGRDLRARKRRAGRYQDWLQAAGRPRSHHRLRRVHRRRISHPRCGQRRICRRPGAHLPGHHLGARGRHSHHQDARRQRRVLPAHHHCCGVSADPAELRLYSARRRRAARPQPHHPVRRLAARACATVRSTAFCSRATSWPTRRASSAI